MTPGQQQQQVWVAGLVIGSLLKLKRKVLGIESVQGHDDANGVHQPWATVTMTDGTKLLVAVTVLP